jgi:NAD(P)-dependent dehydrogenase (short-subunit alcohol dehydrogenase family)
MNEIEQHLSSAAMARDRSRGEFEGQVVVVLGAGSSAPGWSIGRASSLQFAREGAHVIAVDLNEEEANLTTELIHAEGLLATAVAGDVSDDGFVKDLAARVLKEQSRVDVLHHNLGVGKPGGVFEISAEDFNRVLQINLTSLLLACQAFLPNMIARRRGAIVAMSSVAGQRYIHFPHLAYGPSKAALVQFIRMIAGMHAADGIRANVVCPGYIDSPRIIRSVVKQRPDLTMKEFLDHQASRVPMGQMGTPWDIADAVLFLASSRSRFVTGIELVVDGGTSMEVRK